MAKTSNSARNPPTNTRPTAAVWISYSPDSSSYAAIGLHPISRGTSFARWNSRVVAPASIAGVTHKVQ